MIIATSLTAAKYNRRAEFAARAVEAVLRPLQALMAVPTTFLFLAALTAMLLRHPDVRFYEIDRVAFALLAVAWWAGPLCFGSACSSWNARAGP